MNGVLGQCLDAATSRVSSKVMFFFRSNFFVVRLEIMPNFRITGV